MLDAGLGAHHLNIAGCRAAFIPLIISMGNSPFADMGINFHTPEQMCIKAFLRGDPVIIDRAVQDLKKRGIVNVTKERGEKAP